MGLVLALVGAVATGVLAGLNEVTKGPIAEAIRLETLKALRTVLPEGYDNDPVADTIFLIDKRLNKKETPVKFYRATKAGQPFASAFVVTAPDGYSGNISTIMAVSTDGIVTGIEVIAHAETPGLGDKIQRNVSDWPLFFNGKTKDNVKWGVKKDGGDFDQFAGATITPRAVVHSVKRGLDFFLEQQAKIFAPAPAPAQPDAAAAKQ
uniref:Ion-translocating oxidoreductase complex subunit G n=1 Tax=Magnetococcus massalia (strain MO-1) TaxID=451514 RepID=A0A1S7LPW1_MAGMO|nr:Electron transport complex protein rnfG [Candidatus Magnetococcus massalia]